MIPTSSEVWVMTANRSLRSIYLETGVPDCEASLRYFIRNSSYLIGRIELLLCPEESIVAPNRLRLLDGIAISIR